MRVKSLLSVCICAGCFALVGQAGEWAQFRGPSGSGVSAEAQLPRLMTYLKAMAEGAMVPVWELFAVNAFEELEPLLERPEDGTPFLERDAGSRGLPGERFAGGSFASGSRRTGCEMLATGSWM